MGLSSKKKILLTGSNGLVGQKIAELAFQNKDVEFVLISYSNNNLSDLPFRFYPADITNSAVINNIIAQEQPNLIVNCAGISQVDDCEKDQAKCWSVNVEAVGHMVKAANKIGCRFIQFSTDFVFDGAKGMYVEEDLPNPVNVYGNANLEAEKIVLQEAIDFAIVRTVLVYGVTKNMSRSNLVLWVKGALENGKNITVVDDQFRTPTLAEDLAFGTMKLALSDFQGIYHISGDEYVSVYEFALKVAEFFNLDRSLISPISSLSLNQIGKRPPKTGFDISKARRDLSYAPVSLFQGLEFVKQQFEMKKSNN